MKYVLTKDGRAFAYEVENETDLDDEFIFMGALIAKSKKEGFEVLKVVDAVEDLCDEFVLENEIVSTSKCSIMNRRIFEHMRKAIFEASKITHKKCYGAIWTDKGLIFIAVMNEKGVMELL